LTEAVREQVGRTHDVDKLRVERPASGSGKIFCFDQEAVGCERRRGKRQGEAESAETFHEFHEVSLNLKNRK
jgi:hypothetical protein